MGADSGQPDFTAGRSKRQGCSVLGARELNSILRGVVCVWSCHTSGHIGPSCSAPPLSVGPTQHRDVDAALVASSVGKRREIRSVYLQGYLLSLSFP